MRSLLLALALAGCGASQAGTLPDVTARQVAVAAFGSENLRCVVQATSRAQADACRADVHAYWCTHGLPEVCAEGGDQ